MACATASASQGLTQIPGLIVARTALQAAMCGSRSVRWAVGLRAEAEASVAIEEEFLTRRCDTISNSQHNDATDARTKARDHSEEEKEERGCCDSCRIQPTLWFKRPVSTTASATLPAPPWDAPSPDPSAAPRSNSPSTRNTT